MPIIVHIFALENCRLKKKKKKKKKKCKFFMKMNNGLFEVLTSAKC